MKDTQFGPPIDPMPQSDPPFRLSLLGRVDLRRPDGTEVSSLLAQSKRIALLAFLAVEGAGGFVPRDLVVSMLWSESDEARARQSLRNALYRIRQRLGEEVVVNRGAGEVGIDTARLTIDVVEFRRAVREARFRDAAALYRGPFLPAFHLDDDAEFEEWTARVRTALHGDALWAFREAAVACEGGGDVEAARTLLRRAQELAPQDEEILRHRLLLLAGRGNRAAAVAEGRQWVEALGATLGVPPSAATLRLLEELEAGAPAGDRQESAVPPRGRFASESLPSSPEASPPPTTPVPERRRARSRGAAGWLLGPAVLIAGAWALAYRAVPLPPADRGVVFERLAADTAAGGTAAGLAVAGLMARLMGSEGARVVLPPEGIPGVSRDGVERRLVSGTVRREGRGLVAHVALSTTSRPDDVLVRATAQVDRYDLETLAVRLLDALEGRSRQTLSAGIVIPALTAAPSAVLPFFEGERLALAGHTAEALDAYERALRVDSGFAMAHFRVSLQLQALGRREEALMASDRAVALSTRMTNEERRLLDAWRVQMWGNVEQAHPLFEALAAARGPDPEVWSPLAEIRFHWGPQLGIPRQAADSAFLRLLQIRPDDVDALAHHLRLMGPTAPPEEVEQVARRLSALGAPDEVVTEAAAVAALSRRQPLDAGFSGWAVAGPFNAESRRLTQLAASARVPADLVPFLRSLPPTDEERRWVLRSLLVVQVLASSGRMEEALDELVSLGERFPDRALEYRTLLWATHPLGAPLDTLRALRSGLRAAPGADRVLMEAAPNPGIYTPRALVLDAMLTRRLGEPIDSAAVLARVVEWPEPLAIDYRDYVLLEILGAQGNHERSLGVLGPGRPQLQRVRPDPLSYLAGTSRWARVESLLALGREEEALRWVDTYPDVGGYDLIYLPLASLTRARILERAGRDLEAAAAYRRAAELLEGADLEFKSLHDEARRGAERAGAGPGG